MDQLADLVAALLGAVLTALAAAAIPIAVQHLQKLGLQISAEQEAKARSAAESAVLQVEEVVESRIKALGQPIADKSRVKLEAATSAIVDKLPGISAEEARGLAQEAVARVGLGATDLAGKLVAASRT